MSTTPQKPPAKAVSLDPAINEMVQVAEIAALPTVWDRYRAQHPQCKFGSDGTCWSSASGAVPYHAQAKLGIWAARMPIPSRRETCCGDRGGYGGPLRPCADDGSNAEAGFHEGKGEYKISDPRRLREAAQLFGIEANGRGDLEITGDLAGFFASQFAWSEEPSATLKLAPQKRQALWKKLDIEPTGIDSAVVELLHGRTWVWITTTAT
jgi:carbon-monoxide dehydrogenase catalytic subunit